jgi:hypothetical protein
MLWIDALHSLIQTLIVKAFIFSLSTGSCVGSHGQIVLLIVLLSSENEMRSSMLWRIDVLEDRLMIYTAHYKLYRVSA